MVAKSDPDQFSEEEAQRRFQALLRAAVTTPPKPLKDMPKKRAKQARHRSVKGVPSGKD
jgi:hypothetical protein